MSACTRWAIPTTSASLVAWPVLAEVLAAAAVITLGFVGHARPGRGGWALFAAGVVLATLAVVALGWVGFALNFNAH